MNAITLSCLKDGHDNSLIGSLAGALWPRIHKLNVFIVTAKLHVIHLKEVGRLAMPRLIKPLHMIPTVAKQRAEEGHQRNYPHQGSWKDNPDISLVPRPLYAHGARFLPRRNKGLVSTVLRMR